VLKGGSGSNVVQLESVKASLADALAQRKRSLERQIRLFGTGTWGPQFAGTGRFRALVGRPVSELQGVQKLDNEAVVDVTGSKLLRALPKDSPLLPSPLAGYLPHLRYGSWIALALNGWIAAVSHTYGMGGKLRFSLLASDTDCRAGKNSARIFLLSGATANPQFRELRVTLSS
jgi:hypothetical protein